MPFRGKLEGFTLCLNGLLELAFSKEALSEGVENEGGLGLESGSFPGKLEGPVQLRIVSGEEPGVVVQQRGVTFAHLLDEVFAHGDHLGDIISILVGLHEHPGMVNNAGGLLLLLEVGKQGVGATAAALDEAQQRQAPLGALLQRRGGILRFEDLLEEGLGPGVLPSFFFFFSELEGDLEVLRFLVGLLLEGSIGLAGEDRLDGADEAVRRPEAGDAIELFTFSIDDEQGREAADAVALDDLFSLTLLGVDLDRDEVLVQQGGDVFVRIGLTDQYFAPSSPVGVEIDIDQLLAFRGLLQGIVKGSLGPLNAFGRC